MPTYDYRCDACSHEFEEFQSMSAKPLRKCPSCAKPKLKRLIGTGAGIIFKGSGFYETDYRSDSYSKAAKAEKESSTSSSAATTTSTTSDAAPAASSDTAKPKAEAPKKTSAKSEPKPAKT